MTDIYIKRRDNKPGCRRIVILLVILGIAGIIWGGVYLHSRIRKSKATESPAEPSQATVEAPIASVELPPAKPQAKPAQAAPKPVPTPHHAAKPQATAPSASNARLVEEIKQHASRGELQEARVKSYQMLNNARTATETRQAEAFLNAINTRMVFSPSPMKEKVMYTIKSGDTLGELAKQHGTTVDLIRKSNNIKGSLIRIGDRYRILQGQFSIAVDRSDNTLVVKLDDRFFKRYPVGTGKFEKTPIGSFKVTDRIAQPTWWRPDGKAVPYGDPENVLGTHWLSLDIRGYGIHGTWEPETIGHAASAGCIRLLNEDVEELYTLIPIGTPVVIQE
jgi:lipoprotein-anchoring transpeptidase ErfK/SrfK